MSDALNQLISEWAALGAGFDAPRRAHTDIDLERTILQTARLAPKMPRLVVMATTWLHVFGDAVAKHRLLRLIEQELDPQDQPILGLLLDLAQQGTHPPEFAAITRRLPPQSPARPLYEHARANRKRAELARDRASDVSRNWGLWVQPFDRKSDALRPAQWLMTRHEDLRTRTDFRGDLRASILAALRHDAIEPVSETRLAELAGGSRSQIRNALDNLTLTGRVTVNRAQGANRLEISRPDAA